MGSRSRFLEIVKRYPIPVIALIGLFVGTVFDRILGERLLADYAWYAALIIGGIPIIISIGRQMYRGKFVVDIIAMLAILTAIIMDEAFAGVVIVLMQSSGVAIENYGMQRATGELKRLLERKPKIAHIRIGEDMKDIPAGQVVPGDNLLVKQGELIPVDSYIKDGVGELDESLVTGEPKILVRKPGEKVLSGTVNVGSTIEIIAEKKESDSEYGRIIELVRNAREVKAPIQRTADRYGMWLIPITLAAALGGWVFTRDPVTILSVFVVATPCPLILATPIALMGGLNRATKHGIIIKGGGAIEVLGKVDEVVFDKTGTLTLGKPTMKEVIPLTDISADRLLFLAGSAEQLSNHPLAKVIVKEAKVRVGRLSLPTEFHEIPGKGIIAMVDDLEVSVGSLDFCNGANGLKEIKDEVSPDKEQATMMTSCISIAGIASGKISFSDELRPGVNEMIKALRTHGVQRTVMLTGDSLNNARLVANLAGIDSYRYNLKPEDKLNFIKEEIESRKTVMMVGDGINDAPALTAASVAIAMGAEGSDISAESSEVVLTEDRIEKVSDALSIGRRSLSIAIQSILVGMALSGLFMVLAATGYIYPAEGALIQEGVDALAILNSVRSAM